MCDKQAETITSSQRSTRERRRKNRRRTRDRKCHCCGRISPFSWSCRCGFAICQQCMYENFWGLSCNGITWVCPECGGQNGFGNQ